MTRISEAEYSALLEKRSQGGHGSNMPILQPTEKAKRGVMNNTERAYMNLYLEPRKRSGEILEYWFEVFTFKLADDTRYTPDFVAVRPNRLLEVHEVKGGKDNAPHGCHIREDAWVKFKVARRMFPHFLFYLCVKQTIKQGGGWHLKNF